MIKKLKIDKDRCLTSKNEQKRIEESLKVQQEMTPKVLTLMKEAGINPFTSIEILGSSMLMLMCFIQELNSQVDMMDSFCGFFDKMKERLHVEMPKACHNGQLKKDNDRNKN